MGGGDVVIGEIEASSALMSLCVVSGAVTRVDGSPVANGTVTFNSRVPQTIAGTVAQPLLVSSSTDGNGNLAAISLGQGLFLQIYVNDNGITYPPMAGLVPNAATATFNQLIAL